MYDSQVLEPAIQLAEDGFPVSPIAARIWAGGLRQLKAGKGDAFLTKDGNTPKYGQIQRNPDLATTFRTLAEEGAQEGGSTLHAVQECGHPCVVWRWPSA